jgi:hypothetical protein
MCVPQHGDSLAASRAQSRTVVRGDKVLTDGAAPLVQALNQKEEADQMRQVA